MKLGKIACSTIIFTLGVIGESGFAKAAPSMLEILQPRAGIYVLSATDEANPCRASLGDLKLGQEIRLNVDVPTKTTEYVEKGDVIVSLEKGDSTRGWYTLFDEPAFSRINGWSTRSFGFMGQPYWVTHKSTYDSSTETLQHIDSISAITGSESSIQTIIFSDADSGKFIYIDEIVDYNALGFETKRTTDYRCEFTRKN